MKKIDVEIVVGVLTAIVGLFIVKKILDKKGKNIGLLTETTDVVGSGAEAVKDLVVSKNSASFPLKKGSIGINVASLQTYLNKNGYYGTKKLTVDGVFGTLTEKAVVNMKTKSASKEMSDFIANQLFVSGDFGNKVEKAFYDKFIK